MKFVLLTCLVTLLATPISAQPEESPEEQPLRSSAELQLHNYGNFFQAREGSDEQSVNALAAAYRAFWARQGDSPDFYARLAALRYSGGASETSYTGQVGASNYGSTHWWDVSLERTENGYAFEVGETLASANITALLGHYSYPLARDWRVGADAYFERTGFDVETGFEGDYRSLGAQVRYRGFGDLIQPRFGYIVGERDVRSNSDSYDERSWYLELRSEPLDSIQVTLRYRDRSRDYQTIDRGEERMDWRLRAAIRQNDHLSWAASYTGEQVDSSLPGRDFDRSQAYVGVVYEF